MADLAKLVVKLEAQTAKYQRDLEKAQRQNRTFSEKAKKHFKDARGAYIGFAAAVGGAFATISRGLDRQAELFDLSTRLGATTKGLSQLQYAAEQSGVSVSTLNMGLQRMVRRVAEAASGTGEAKGALEELNIVAGDLNQLKPEDQFRVLADAIMKVENPADRVRLAMKLFDSEGVSLIQTMQGGSEGIQRFAEEADKLGVSVDDGAAAAAKRASDAFTRLGGVFTGASNTIAAQFAPEIEAIANFMAEALPKAANFAQAAMLRIRQGFVNVALAAVNVRIKWNELTRDFTEADELRESARILREMSNDIGSQAALVGVTTKTMADYKKETDKATYSNVMFGDGLELITVNARKVKNELASTKDEIPAFWQEAQESFEVSKKMMQESTAPAEDASVMDKFFGEDALARLFSDFDNIEQRFKELLVRMAAEALAKNIVSIFSGGSGGAGGAVGGGFGSFFGNLFGRANGGPVNANTPYMVGENGPEVFMPSASGTIVPNHQTESGGGNVSVIAALGDREITKWLGSKSGEKVVLAHLQRNRATVQALARA